MATKFKNNELFDLFNLDNNDLKHNVSIADITLILTSYFKKADTPKDEVLLTSISFISKKLLPIFGTSRIIMELLEKSFSKLYDIFEIVVDSISRNQRTINDSKISNFLNNLQIVFKKVEEESPLELCDLSLFIEYGTKFLEKYFALLKDFETRIDVSEENKLCLHKILQQCFDLHSEIMSILNKNNNLLICQAEDGSLKNMEKFLANLLRMAKVLVSFNIIACTTTLKKFLKLSIANSKFFESRIEKNFKWLTDTVKFLCEQIHFLLLQFHNEEFRNRPISAMTKYIKVSVFFIQCMIKITEHFDVQNIFGFHHIIPVFFEIYRLSTVLNSDTYNLIEQCLTVNIMSLIKIVYKTEDFIGELLKKSHDTIDDSGFCIVGIEIIDTLARTRDQYEFSVYFYGQFFEVLFAKIPNCLEVFLLQENYIKLEVGMISLWNLYHENVDVMKTFEEILVEGILQYDLKLSKICFDIWIYLARTVNVKTCYHYFEFWADINESFSIFCYDPKIVPIEYLVQVFYERLPKECKNNVWSNLNLTEECRLTYTLGMNRIVDESKRLSFENYLQEKLLYNLNLIIEKQNYNYKTYADIIKLFKLLCSSKINHRNISKLLLNLTELIAFDINFEKHEYFINIFILFLLSHFNNFDEYVKNTIWKKIENLENVSNLPMKLRINKLKKLLSQGFISDNLTFDVEEQILEYTNNFNTKFNVLSHERFTLLQQIKKIPHPAIIWKCEVDSACRGNIQNMPNIQVEPLPKKLKATQKAECGDYSVVRKTLQNAKEIVNHFQCSAMSPNDLQDLKEIVILLNGIIDTNA